MHFVHTMTESLRNYFCSLQESVSEEHDGDCEGALSFQLASDNARTSSVPTVCSSEEISRSASFSSSSSGKGSEQHSIAFSRWESMPTERLRASFSSSKGSLQHSVDTSTLSRWESMPKEHKHDGAPPQPSRR